jgi:RNA polymerase sigma factor (sigma-70 family)
MPPKYAINDAEDLLIKGCCAQHPLAQKYLYERYFGAMLAVAFRYANDRSEAIDVLNRAFLKIFDSIHRYQPTASLRSWMRTIVVRTALNQLRSKVQFSVLDTDIMEATPLNNDAFLDADTEYILNAIQQLPAATRTVFNLYEIEGFHHAEIAEMLKISVGTSKWHLAEAKNKLRLLLTTKKSIVLEYECQ